MNLVYAAKSDADGRAQLKMMGESAVAGMLAMHTFNDIMTGANPLTAEEIRRLHEKRSQWSFLSTWYKS
jgi:hypothetical protein